MNAAPRAERQALFYSPEVKRVEKLFLADPPAVDRIEFSDEHGGSVTRELAIPYLAGMDEVHVDEAALALRAEGRPLDIADFTVTAGSGAEQGLKLQLAVPARLLEVEFSAAPLAGAVDPNTRLVVRPLNAGRAGPPAYALPPFSLASPLFAPLLGGLSNPVGGVVRLPRIAGSGWLFQLATGEALDKLQPIPFPLSIRRVRIDALPRNVRIELLGPPQSVLWGQPEVLLPESGEQPVSFTPAAQNVLAAALPTAQGTLPVRLVFHSDAGGTLAVTRRRLQASYLARPLAAQTTQRLAGAWTPLTLNAPTGRQASGSRARLLARLLDRELNDASPLAEAQPPGGGLRLRGERRLACAVAVAPRPGEAAGAPVPLVALRLFLATRDAAEAVLQLHPDVAGLPGPPAGDPVVVQCAAGSAGWVDFVLRQDLPVISAGAPLWVSLRSNRGEVLWHGCGDGKVWLDAGRGAAWQSPGLPLAAGQAPLVQLFHRPSPAQAASAPRVALRCGTRELSSDLLAGATPRSENEWLCADFSLPSALLTELALAKGAPRAATTIHLATRRLLDLIFDDLVLIYDPFG